MTQNRPRVIGLTGGIATGKSTVTQILRKKGYKVIDADVIARGILNIDQDAYKEVVKFFGAKVLNADKTINRAYLGDRIFGDEKLRKKLNAITHPYIIQQIKQQIDASKHKILFLDMPLLIEIYDDIVGEGICIDEVWLVYCDREAQIKRLMKRDGISYEKATLKVNAQMDIEEKRKFSDRVIENTKDKAYLIENIDIALNQKFYQ